MAAGAALRGVLAVASMASAGALLPTSLSAQGSAPDVAGEVFVGSELERYLRVLQVAGEAQPYPWSSRGFSPREVERIATGSDSHPWASRYRVERDSTGAFAWSWVSPEGSFIANSAFPYGSNDGAVWAGRGVTAVVKGGVAASRGPLTLVVAPTISWAQNASFSLVDNGEEGRLAFGDARNPRDIDLPQRFGDGSYATIDAGQSSLRLELGRVSAGLSNANQYWGPAIDHALLLGDNAPGFAHAFAGTAMPQDVWIGRLHARATWGVLEQSDYAVLEGTAARRMMAGLLAVFSPRGVPGLEIGGARFFHTAWREGGPTASDFLRPFEGLLKSSLRDSNDSTTVVDNPDNQLASVFGRWVFPRSGLELYGEYAREDHSWDFRDLALEPDHDSAYMIGAQKVWRRSPTSLLALRGEVMNSAVSHLVRGRHQVPFYVHEQTRQGHTHRGQVLGSAAGYGGGAAVVALDHYREGGRWSLKWSRVVQGQQGDFWRTGELSPRGLDVLQTLGGELLWFRDRWELWGGVEGVYQLNRAFQSDAVNVNGELGARMRI